MKTYIILALFLAVSCSSNKKGTTSKEIPSDISKEDFKTPKKVRYATVKDRYQGLKSSVVSDETLGGLDESDFDDNLVEKDDLGKIAQYCYEKDFEDAFKLIDEIYPVYKQNPIYWNQVGNCYRLKGERRKALLYYNKSLEYKSSYSPVYNNIGILYYSEGRDQKALVGFKKASSADRYAKTPKLNLARLYLKYSLGAKALPILQGLIRLNSGDSSVKVLLGHAYLMKKDYKNAYDWFQKTDKGILKKPHNAVNYAIATYKLGKLDAAKDIVEDIDLEEAKGRLKEHIKQTAQTMGARL